MRTAVVIFVWIAWVICMAIMKKIGPESFRAYAIYGALVCIAFTALAVSGVI